MRKLKLVAASLILLPAVSTAAPQGAAALRANSNGQVAISVTDAGDKASFVRTQGDLLPAVSGENRKAKADAFFNRHGAMLGLERSSELRELRTVTDDWGNTTIRYTQRYNGVPVFGAWVNANLRNDGSLTTVNGDLVDGLSLNTIPSVAAVDAAGQALQHVAASKPAKGLRTTQPQLYIYRVNGNSNRTGTPILAWHVEVANGRDVREMVFVDAHSGKVVDQFDGIQDALDRRVYNGGFGSGFLVWSEGDAAPTGTASIDNLIDYTADAYYFYSNLTNGNYLSWSGDDAIMHAVNNDPGIVCPNANWNGLSINFCDGTSSDDVVGHEWSHAYTQATHGLIYRWQSGALNESYSDIYGETIDFLNLAGTDTQASLRSVGLCSSFGGSLPPTFAADSPASIAGGFTAQGAQFNPSAANVIGKDLLLVNDNSGVSSTDGCEAIATDLTDAVALIDRGDCPFVTKVQNAQAAGAVGVVIANNDGDGVINMGGSGSFGIPSVFVGQTDGQTLRNTGSTPTVSITIGGGSETSRRWLMGEDASAFGGHIRDMWEPRCMGDPGKVSDAQYHCDGDVDNGGVHINSGIPNHAFALLVDGGTFNDVTVDAIGMDKAAHIYWRAATNYQGPTSDFADHADSMEASCEDLVGMSLPTLSTEIGGAGSNVTITTADCATVAAAMTAVEMRNEPSQCNFQTILAQDTPDLCDASSTAQSVFSEDFESGLGGWTVGQRSIVNPATFSGPDWSATNVGLPGSHPGAAAYGPNLILGNCTTDIEAGIIYLQSPVIVLPGSPAKMAFDHNVMTEADYDGTNLKVSVNGGAYALVQPSSFTFNGYNGNLVSSDNPMSGQAAFHGTDDGSLSSNWGQSRIDLATLANPGDTVQLRFEVGMDGCNGLFGWYVDNVNVYSCETGSVDTDGDLVADDVDNCTLVPNADQRDTNGDGYGNICDADLNNSGTVEFGDLQIMKAAFFATPASPAWNPDADLNGDDAVNFADLFIAKESIFGPPGPSGLTP